MIKGYSPSYNHIKSLGTSLYIFDTDVLRDRVAMLKKHLGQSIDICYAMKANPFVVASMKEYIDRYEVCSHGEFRICEKAELPMEKVVLSGVYKEEEDTKRIVAKYRDKILYTSESVNQFLLVNEAAIEANTKVDVILRITTGNQFGMNEEELCKLVESRETYKGINIKGIQHFSGTQRKKMNNFKEELAYCDKLIEKLLVEYGFEAEELEFGTGFYFDYFQPSKKKDGEVYTEEQSRLADEILVKDFKKCLDEMKFKGKLALEIGRFISAPCGRYYTSIVDYKENGGINFAIVDGGIHQINYFGQMMGMKLPWYRQLKKDGEVFCDGDEIVNVSGSLCTINDNIVKQMPLTKAEIGDILEFRNCGAYSMTEIPALFLSRDLPKVYTYSQEEGLVLVRDRVEAFQFNF